MTQSGTRPVAQPVPRLPYGHPDITCFLASQQIRRLHSFRTIALDELLHQPRTHTA
ncbi:hypothetical protein [Streptomyces sp. NPDC048256]|uniref:hypothetical protein n=1 Tax=unclassified Streptomyces TaxID=2593676 RepID=UPI0033C4324A